MDFSGEVAEWQRKNAEGEAGNSRRSAVIEALDVRGGNTYLDVGCGGGLLVQEVGTAAQVANWSKMPEQCAKTSLV